MLIAVAEKTIKYNGPSAGERLEFALTTDPISGGDSELDRRVYCTSSD
jgi:hypothetical protein